MPVKGKRHARKTQHDPSLIMYTSSQDSDFTSTSSDASAASSPPDAQLVHSQYADDVRETMTDMEALDRTVGYTTDLTDHDLLRATVVPAADTAPGTTVPKPRKPVQRDDTLRAADDVPVAEPRDRDREQGHVRSPVLAREPTTLESLSRTLRELVPSSIPLPLPLPLPSSIPHPMATPSSSSPRVSRPVSFGSFLSPTQTPGQSRASSSVSRRTSDSGGRDGGGWKRRGSDAADREQGEVFVLDEEHSVRTSTRAWGEGYGQSQATIRGMQIQGEGEEGKYPGEQGLGLGGGEGEEIVFAEFGSVGEMGGGGVRRLLLLLGYNTGLQVWDLTNMGTVAEVLNLRGAQWGKVESAVVLPTPRGEGEGGGEDAFKADRPLLGFISRTEREKEKTERVFVVYSLKTHREVKRVAMKGLTAVNASGGAVVLSTTEPAALHVLNPRTLATVHVVPGASLALFAPPPPPPPTTTTTGSNHGTLSANAIITKDEHQHEHEHVLISPVDISHPHPHSRSQPNDSTSTSTTTHNTPEIPKPKPKPVFTLSHRLLAYASTPPLPHPHPRSPNVGPVGSKLPSQTEIGVAALRIGGSLLSGVRAVGGRAYEAARAAMESASGSGAGAGVERVGTGRFFSRSAPEASAREEGGRGRRYSTASTTTTATAAAAGVAGEREGGSREGHFVTVLDLAPLLHLHAGGGQAEPRVVAEYMVSRSQRVAGLAFAEDGTSLAVSLRDGLTTRVYRLVSAPHAGLPSPGSALGDGAVDVPTPLHTYELRRGRTSAVVERLTWAGDARWLAVGTRKKTVHLFALNPYGGPTDEASHLEGRVRNVDEVQPLSTELAPLVRLRALKPPTSSATMTPHGGAPFVFTFLGAGTTLPASLMPHIPSQPTSHSISSSPSSAHSLASHASSGGQHHDAATGNHQDVLVFEPQYGVLSLRRVTLSQRTRGEDFGATIRVPSTSISLPGVSTLRSIAQARQPSALSKMMEKTELAAHDVVVATWDLRRSVGWKEIRRVFPLGQGPGKRSSTARPNTAETWLSHAELSTCSRSRKLVPKSVYLSHQFSFHYLAEDYHALLRSHCFDVPAQKIDVRRQVSVTSAGPGMGMGESFVSGSSVPSQGMPSSFDEPLASALAAELRYMDPSPPQIPSYPNGPPSRGVARAAIPIRMAAGLTDGMSGGIGRLRREFGKVRTTRSRAHGGSGGANAADRVPLEFDEEDEDFMDPAMPSASEVLAASRGLSRDADAEVSTPSTGIEPLPEDQDEDGTWAGWEPQDKEAVEEVEQFDDIGVGFMDEEWMDRAR